MSETVKIGKWNIPKELFDNYVKFQIMADGYLLGTTDVPSKMYSDYERTMRWNMCVQKIMQLHREICSTIGVPYSEDTDDEFYTAFHRAVYEQTKLKG